MFHSVSLQNALELSVHCDSKLYRTYALAIWACGLAICLYFLAAFPIPIIGFSLHVILVFLGATLLLYQWRYLPLVRGYGLFVLAALLLMASCFFAPTQLSSIEVKAWLTSMTMFVLCATCFRFIRHKIVVRAAEVILAITAFASIAQVVIGPFAYAPGWIGFPRVTIYATGLTIYSSQASIMFLPLSIIVLWANISRPALYRFGIWALACAGVYYTLSRAGWLAFIIGILIIAIFSYRNVGGVRRVIAHVAVGLTACGIAWLLPTFVDCYEPKGDCSAGRWEVLETASRQASNCLTLENCKNSHWMLVSDYSAATRGVTLDVALDAVRAKPLTGVGLGRFPDYYDNARRMLLEKGGGGDGRAIDPRTNMTPHNGYAQLASEAGLPVFIVLLLAIGNLLCNSIKYGSNSSTPLTASIVGILTWLLFHDGFSFRLLWILLGCLASIIYADRTSVAKLNMSGLSTSKSS